MVQTQRHEVLQWRRVPLLRDTLRAFQGLPGAERWQDRREAVISITSLLLLVVVVLLLLLLLLVVVVCYYCYDCYYVY